MEELVQFVGRRALADPPDFLLFINLRRQWVFTTFGHMDTSDVASILVMCKMGYDSVPFPSYDFYENSVNSLKLLPLKDAEQIVILSINA